MVISLYFLFHLAFELIFIVDQTFVDLREKVYLDCRNRSIRDLCSRDHTRVVRVHFFNMNHQMKAMISTIYNIEKSKIFKKSWQKHCKKVQENSITLKAILESVWLPVKNEMLSSKEEFLNGRMAIEKVKKYLRMLDSNFEEVKAEFDLLIANFKTLNKTSRDEKSLLNTRIQQIKDYSKLLDASDAANTIMEFKTKMKLTGDFEEVENIAKVSLLLY